MNDLKLLKHAEQTARDYQQEAARQRQARLAVRNLPPTARLTRRTAHLYYLTQALFWFSVSLPLALSVLLLQSRGFGLQQVGLLLGLYSLTVVLLEVPSGMLADRIGRKRTALLAYALLIGAQVALLWAFSLPLMLASVLLNGAGRAFSSGALQAWFVDRLQEADPNADLQPPLAKAGTFELLALTTGTLLGGALPEVFPTLPEDGVLSPLSVAVALSLAVKLVLVWVVAVSLEEPRVKPERTKARRGRLGPLLAAYRLLRQSAALPLLFGGALCTGFALAGLETFWQPRFAELLGERTAVFGAIMAGGFLVGMLGNLASIPLCRALRGRYALVAALTQGVGGVAFVALALQEGVWAAVGLFWLVYFASGVSGSPIAALLNHAAPSAQRATVLSVTSLVLYAGFFVGSASLGVLAERVSVQAAWVVAGVVLTLSLGFYGRLGRHTARYPRAPEQHAPLA